MMHGREKSDRLIRPKKPSNKAEQSAAEKAEGRSLAKGNPLQDDTNRIQGRRKVNSALERIRQAAERDRDVKFTSLLHHIYSVDMLREAYFSLQAGGRTGRRRRDLAALWRGPRRASSGSFRTAGQGRIPSESGSAGVRTEAGRSAEADWRARAGRQARPAGHGGGTEPDL